MANPQRRVLASSQRRKDYMQPPFRQNERPHQRQMYEPDPGRPPQYHDIYPSYHLPAPGYGPYVPGIPTSPSGGIPWGAGFPARDQSDPVGGRPRQGRGAGQAAYSQRRTGGGQSHRPLGAPNSPPPRIQSPLLPAQSQSSNQQQLGVRPVTDQHLSSAPPSSSTRAKQDEAGDERDQASSQAQYSGDGQRGEDSDEPCSSPSRPVQCGEWGVQQGEGTGDVPCDSPPQDDEVELQQSAGDQPQHGGGEESSSGARRNEGSQREKMHVSCGAPGCKKTFPKTTLYEVSLETDVGTWIKGEKSKLLRKKHISRLLQYINACLNGGGGIVHVHVAPNMLHFLDEQIDNVLMELISDGSLFKDNYERSVDDDRSHVKIRVLPGDRPLSTKDFKTMASTNKGRRELTHFEMRRLVRDLSQQVQQAQPAPSAVGCSIDLTRLVKGEIIESFHENTRTEAKSVEKNNPGRGKGAGSVLNNNKDVAKDGKSLINHAWSNLKLADRITTFSKEDGGGSYLLGIGEKQTDPVPKWREVTKFPALSAEEFEGRKVWDETSPEKGVKEEDKVFRLARPDQVPTTQDRTGDFVCEGVILSENERAALIKHLHGKIVGAVQDNNTGENAESTKAAKAAKSVKPEKKKKKPSNAEEEEVKPEMMWYPPLTNVEDQIQVHFHNVKSPSSENEGGAAGGKRQGEPEAGDFLASNMLIPDCYVIEIEVKNFKGLCFTDPLGPEAYEFESPNVPDKPVRIQWESWLQQQREALSAFAF